MDMNKWYRKSLAVLAVLLLCAVAVSAQGVSFKTDLLRTLAQRVGYTPTATLLSKGYEEAGIYRGHQIIAESSDKRSVTHLGLELFAPSMKESMSSQRQYLNFLERYFLDALTQTSTSTDKRLADDKVYFRKGTLLSVLSVTPDLPFSLTRHDDYFEVNWTKGGTAFVTVVFPPQFELIEGSNLAELKQSMRQRLTAAIDFTPRTWNNDELLATEDGLYRTPSEEYVISSLTDAIYLEKIGGKMRPVFNGNHKEESAANLLLGALQPGKCRMVVEQQLFGFESTQYTIPLSQWLAYCQANGLQLYFALEEVRQDGLKVMVLARNKELNYNHLLSVVVPDKFTTASDIVVKAKLTPFIPTHNIKNLYTQYTTNGKKQPIKY